MLPERNTGAVKQISANPQRPQANYGDIKSNVSVLLWWWQVWGLMWCDPGHWAGGTTFETPRIHRHSKLPTYNCQRGTHPHSAGALHLTLDGLAFLNIYQFTGYVVWWNLEEYSRVLGPLDCIAGPNTCTIYRTLPHPRDSGVYCIWIKARGLNIHSVCLELCCLVQSWLIAY